MSVLRSTTITRPRDAAARSPVSMLDRRVDDALCGADDALSGESHSLSDGLAVALHCCGVPCASLSMPVIAPSLCRVVRASALAERSSQARS